MTSSLSDTRLTLLAVAWWLRALGWCGLALILAPLASWHAIAARRSAHAVEHAEAALERRAAPKHHREERR